MLAFFIIDGVFKIHDGWMLNDYPITPEKLSMTLPFANRAKLFAAFFLLLMVESQAMATLYKCVDKQKQTNYQDKPCQEMTVERLSSSLSKMGSKQESQAFFWKAVNGKSTLYLLGSLHNGGRNPFSLPQLVTDPFNRADVLVVEADMEKIGLKDIANATQGKGLYTDKSKLEDHIKPATWKETLEIAKQLGMDEESLQVAKPWLAALMLNAHFLNQLGYKTEYAIDSLLIQQAQGKKPVIELENQATEIDLIDHFSDQDQEEMLLHTLKQLSQGEDYEKAHFNAWEEGDAEAMDLIVKQSFGSGQAASNLYKTFLLDRNERMVNRLVELTNDGRTYFVVVGADHLGGNKGILKLLAQKGYTITQP